MSHRARETVPVILRHDVARSALHIGPHAGAHRVALRAGVSVLVPLLLLWWFDRVEWSIFAAFGAFASLYGRNRVGLSRVTLQSSLGLMLTTAVGLGAWVGTSEHRVWLAVPVAGVVAGVGSWISDVQEWHPPGPLFLIFGFAAVASIPGSTDHIAIAVLITAASAGFAVTIGSAGSMWRAVTQPRQPRFPRQQVAWAPTARRHIARNVAGVLLSGAIATAVGVGHPYWAMVSAVVPLAARDLFPQIVRGVQRVVGTAVGLVVAAALLHFDLPGLALILLVVILQVGAELLIGRNYAVALIVITPLALLMVHVASPTPTGDLLLDRGVETVIGVLIGILIGYLTRERSTPALSATPDLPDGSHD